MNLFINLCKQDFRTTFRDPLIKGVLFFPFISFALIKWGLPVISMNFPVIKQYEVVILMWACMQSATMFGFIYGFLFLEEKEENIFQVLRIVPVSTFSLVASRLLLGFAISTLVNYCLLHFGGIVKLPLWKELIIALQFSLVAPLMALVLATFAKNRVEGLAQMKVINMAFNIPGLIYILPFKLLHLFALIPTYWSFRSLETAISGDNFSLFFLIGLAYYVLALFVLNRLFQKRVTE